MKNVGIVFGVFGIVSLIVAAYGAPDSAHSSRMIDSFWPGIICLIIALKFWLAGTRPAVDTDETGDGEVAVAPVEALASETNGDSARAAAFRRNAALGIGFGYVPFFYTTLVDRPNLPSPLVLGLALLVGWGWAIWGCVNYARWRGQSGWWGLLGNAPFLGLLVLVFIRDKRARCRQTNSPENSADKDTVAREDRRSGLRYVLLLLPPVVILSYWAFLASSRN